MNDFFSFPVQSIDGSADLLGPLRGKVTLAVNVAIAAYLACGGLTGARAVDRPGTGIAADPAVPACFRPPIAARPRC